MNVKCNPGFYCQKGVCIRQEPKCRCDADCGDRLSCVNGNCVDKCLGVQCPFKSICQRGICMRGGIGCHKELGFGGHHGFLGGRRLLTKDRRW